MAMTLAELLALVTIPVSPDGEPEPSEGAVVVINAKTLGAIGDGVADDTEALQEAFDQAKETSAWVFIPAGRYRLTSSLVFDRSADGAETSGLKAFGEGFAATILVNAIVEGGPHIDLTAGAASTYMYGGCLRDIGFEEDGSGPDSHGVRYRSCSHQTFENLSFTDLNGSGLKSVNTASDADASSHIDFVHIRAYGCEGPAIDNNGGTGGLSLHRLVNCEIGNCGKNGTANLVLDGNIQFSADMCSFASFGSTAPLIHIKSTNVRTRQLSFRGGEYGNNCGTHFKVDAVSTLHVDGIRHVRRRTEPNSTIGFDFADGVSLYSGIKIENCELQIDAPHAIGHPDYVALPAWTWMKLGTGLDIGGSFEAGPPNKSSFASGNVTYAFTSDEAKLRQYRLAEADGRDIRSPRTKRQRVPFNAPGSIVPDLSQGDFYQALLNVSGAFTVQPPIGGQGDSQRMVLTIFKDGSNTITWAAAYEAPTVPTNGGTFAFIYDSASAIWRLVR